MWDGVAPGWEQEADFVDRHTSAATEALFDAVGLSTGQAVLDVACGPGGAGIAAARRVGPAGRVVLADVAPAMVAIAARRSAELPQVTTMVSDQLAVDAQDASFDLAMSRHGLMFAGDPAAAVTESVRVVRLGGHVAAITWDSRAANPWLGRLLDAVGEQLGFSIPPPGIPGPFSLDDPEVLGEALRAGGLSDVVVVAVPTPMTADSPEAWWERVVQLAGPLSLMLAGMDPDTRGGIRDRALGYAAESARTSAAGITFEGSSLLGYGRRRP
jgi:SAM-dependent methyltransferase